MIKKIAMIGLSAMVLTGCNDGLFDAFAVDAKKEDQFARPAKIATAKKVAFNFSKTFPGVTEASRSSVLAFRVAGQIDELPVLSGQVLKEGDIIARLDDTPYRNVVVTRQASFDLAKTQLERTEALYKKKHVAKAVLDEAKSNFAAAEVALKIAREDVGYTTLKAPFDGEIARIDAERFQNISAGAPVIQFQGMKNIDIAFNIPEKLLLMFNPSKNVPLPIFEIAFDAHPEQKFIAKYKEHDALPDPVTRSFQVTATMPRPTELSVLPGMSVNVSVNTGHVLKNLETSGVLVPLEAVFDEAGKKWVWKVDDENQARKTEVEVSGLEDVSVRIRSGLTDGDRVIAVGVSHVSEGLKVRPYKKERGL